MKTGIEFHCVSKQYDLRGKAPPAVNDISFQIAKGSLSTLLGPSGCGKTTTLRMIAGLESPTTGRIFIDGRDVTALGPAQRNVSLVFQSYALFPHMDVLDNVAYGPSVSGLSRQQARHKARQSLASVGLQDYEVRMPGELSGGQQQRVALARALVLEPSVLLFDEPLSNLDARLRRQMREEIRTLQQRLQLTVVYVTHDQSEALAVSDSIIVMKEGRIAQQGTPRDLYERPNSEFVAGFMGEAVLMQARWHEGRLWLDGLAVPLPGAGRHSSDPGLSATGHGVQAAAQQKLLEELPEGAAVTLAIRPESWQLSAADGDLADGGAVKRAGDPDALPGVVRRATYLGGSHEYTVLTSLGEIFLIAPLQSWQARVGDKVALRLSAQGIAVLGPAA